VDAAHALLEAHRVPRDVVVDHQPAELEVDAFTRGLGGDEHLCVLAELALGVDARVRRVAVADGHAAMDLRAREAPLAELAERTPVLAVAGEVVERVLVLCEDEELHPRVAEDLLLIEHLLQLDELRLDLALLKSACLVDELVEALDLLAQRDGVDDEDRLLRVLHDLRLLVFGQVVEVLGQLAVDLLLAIALRVLEDLAALVAHALEAAAHGVHAGREAKLTGAGQKTGQVHQRVLHAQQLALLEATPEKTPFDGEPLHFKLGVEAARLGLAYEYDPYFSLSIARVDPLPHQLEAVYDYFLKLPRIRFLLADDPGAGKTIMAGLLLKELKVRGLVKRTLIVAPANLTFQWQRELKDKFREQFDVMRGEVLRTQYGQNPWQEHNQVVTSVSWISRVEDAKESLLRSQWDLVIVDEAHKMSAYSADKKTLAFQIGEALSQRTDHFLLMTATPHKGDPENFRLFLSLLDRDVYGDVKSLEEAMRRHEAPFYLRRLKEALVAFPDPETGEVKKLFTNRDVRTTKFELDGDEFDFYDALTRYVEDQSIKAAAAENVQANILGFQMAMLQRQRQAGAQSSPAPEFCRRRSTACSGPANLEQLLDVTLQHVALRERLDQPLELSLAVGIFLEKQAVVDPVAVAAVVDDASRTQNPELPRDVRLREAERFLEMADAELPVREQRDDAQTSLVSQSAEEARDGSDLHGRRCMRHHDIRISLCRHADKDENQLRLFNRAASLPTRNNGRR
jgi:hypothetical protein